MDKATSSGIGSFWGKAAVAGIIGGLAMGVYLMFAMFFLDRGFFGPLNMIAATFTAYRPPAEGFVVGPTLTGLILHVIASAFWGFALGLIIRGLPGFMTGAGISLVTGLAYGVAVWLIMGRLIGPMLDPYMAMAPPWNYFFAHLLYGAVTAWALYAWSHDRELATIRARQAGPGKEGLGVRPT
jgi:hypothetical protein